MKKFLSGCIACITCSLTFSQTTLETESLMYRNAYEYILNDSINKDRIISVADCMTDLGMYWDTGLEEYPQEKERLRSYRRERKYRYFEPYFSPLLHCLFRNKNADISNTVVFFSPVVDLMLRADLEFYELGSGRAKFRHDAYWFGMSYMYLFLFNEDGTIKKALGMEFILN